MSTSIGDSGTYPGRNHSLSQLLYAAKRQLQDGAFDEKYVRRRRHVTPRKISEAHLM